MGTNFKDDDPVPPPSEAPTSVGLGSGKIRQNIFNKADAPLEKTDYRMVVELMGFDDTKGQRGGVDIVAVLDVSGSMGGKKLEKLKTSMKFLLKKLDPIDRLSIVKFSSNALRLCQLTGMDENGKDKIEKLINNLHAGGGTNISPGLETALSVLAQRRQQEGRTSAIMLMSDGELSNGCVHPSAVDVSAVAVYTFGLGRNHDSQLLQDIARRSDKGTYSIADVDGSDSASLNIAFSSCLAGLLSVVVQDLELTITQKESEIQEVRAGIYDQTQVKELYKISFGNLYNREKRSTTVFLSLPAVDNRTAMDILKISFSYRPSGGGNLFRSTPIAVTVTRTSSPVTKEPIEVANEIARGDTAAAIEEARKKADANDFDGARDTMENAKESLHSLGREADKLIQALKYEVQEFLRLLKDPEIYRKEGRAFALSSELSHKLQRFAARGDANQLVALAIPLVVEFVNQAIEFDKDRNFKVSTTNEDKEREAEKAAKLDAAAAEKKKELDEEIKILMKKAEKIEKEKAAKKNDPLVTQADALKHHLGQAIDSLKAIQELIDVLQKSA